MGFFNFMSGKKKDVVPILGKNDSAFKIFKIGTGNTKISGGTNAWNKDNGEEFPFDPVMTEKLYIKHGLSAGIVDKYVDYIMSGGFYIVCEDERAKEIINNFNREVNMDTVLRAWIKEALIKPHGVLEILKSKDTIVGLKLTDGKTIHVIRDNKGKILNFVQIVGANDRIILKPETIVQLCFNKIGTCAYGLGIMSQNVVTTDNLLELENSMRVLVKRKANAPIHVKIGTEKEPADDASISQIGADLEYLHDKHEWATGHAFEIKTAYDVNLGDKFVEPINITMKNLIAGYQVPEVLLGFGNIPEGLAKVQMEAFQRRIKSFQEEIEKVIEENIYKRILESNGLDVHVEFEWGQPTDEFTEKRVALYNTLISNFGISPEFKKQMEKDMAKLLGFKDAEIETAEEQRKREEAQKLPLVPGQNRQEKLQMSLTSTKLNWEELDKKKLNEFLDFDYQKYLETIVLTTERDKFKDLMANTEEELKRGYLSQSKVNDLKEILKEAFKKNLSVSDIAAKLNNRNIIPNLLNEEGTVQMFSDNRSIMVARTETVRLSALGTASYFQDKGYKKYSWVTSLGDRTCEICNGLNGKIFEFGKGPMPPTNTHINCRCSISNVEG